MHVFTIAPAWQAYKNMNRSSELTIYKELSYGDTWH